MWVGAMDHHVSRRTSNTLWASPNRFARVLSVQVVDARGLPAARDLALVLKAGGRSEQVPLLLSQADIEAGGSGRLDGGKLTDRVNVVLDSKRSRAVLHLHAEVIDGWWHRSQDFVAHCLTTERWADPGEPGLAAPEWLPLLDVDGAADAEEASHRLDAPALLVRVQCFDAENLNEATSRARLFSCYSASGTELLPAECDRMLSDVAAGWRPDRSNAAEDDDGQPRSVCQACAGRSLAAFGCYRPEESMLTYLMYYHTLFWVVCRAPGEEHIPVVHRLFFVLLSMCFNLLVRARACTCDMRMHPPVGHLHCNCFGYQGCTCGMRMHPRVGHLHCNCFRCQGRTCGMRMHPQNKFGNWPHTAETFPPCHWLLSVAPRLFGTNEIWSYARL